MQRQRSYKVHLNTISNGELSDPLCDSVNRGLTLFRLRVVYITRVINLVSFITRALTNTSVGTTFDTVSRFNASRTLLFRSIDTFAFENNKYIS